MKKTLILAVAVLACGLTGCKTKLDKALEQLKDDNAEFHLLMDRNGLKIDRYNPTPRTNSAPADAEALKAKIRQALDGK